MFSPFCHLPRHDIGIIPTTENLAILGQSTVVTAVCDHVELETHCGAKIPFAGGSREAWNHSCVSCVSVQKNKQGVNKPRGGGSVRERGVFTITVVPSRAVVIPPRNFVFRDFDWVCLFWPPPPLVGHFVLLLPFWSSFVLEISGYVDWKETRECIVVRRLFQQSTIRRRILKKMPYGEKEALTFGILIWIWNQITQLATSESRDFFWNLGAITVPKIKISRC